MKKSSSLVSSRRQFLSNVLPAGTLLCFGCSNLLALNQSEEQSNVASDKHKFLEDSEMSFKELFIYAYHRNLIPIMKSLASDIGKDKFVEIIKKASSEAMVQIIIPGLRSGKLKPLRSDFMKHVVTKKDVRRTEKSLEYKVTECLFAEVFREMDAADIGYATQCFPDFAVASFSNPTRKLIRTKTLMQGQDFCDFRYVWEE